MVRRCAAVGVEVVVDAVLNHMANRQGSGSGRAGTPIGPGCRRWAFRGYALHADWRRSMQLQHVEAVKTLGYQ